MEVIPVEPQDQLLELGRIEFLLPCQVHQHTGIKVPAARPHDNSAGRGQSHARVNRLPVLHGGDARTIAKVRDE